MDIKLGKGLGATIKAQVDEANALYQPALAKAKANKAFMDAIITDNGYTLEAFGEYQLKEVDGDIYIVSKKATGA